MTLGAHFVQSGEKVNKIGLIVLAKNPDDWVVLGAILPMFGELHGPPPNSVNVALHQVGETVQRLLISRLEAGCLGEFGNGHFDLMPDMRVLIPDIVLHLIFPRSLHSQFSALKSQKNNYSFGKVY